MYTTIPHTLSDDKEEIEDEGAGITDNALHEMNKSNEDDNESESKVTKDVKENEEEDENAIEEDVDAEDVDFDSHNDVDLI